MTYNEDIARALCAQQQCDEDGVMCIISRQAVLSLSRTPRRLCADRAASPGGDGCEPSNQPQRRAVDVRVSSR